jgi:hypothetical protein
MGILGTYVEAAVWDALWQGGRFDSLSNRDDRRKAFTTEDDAIPGWSVDD